MIKVVVYAGDSPDYPVLCEKTFSSRFSADNFVRRNFSSTDTCVTFTECCEALIPTTKTIHKALW